MVVERGMLERMAFGFGCAAVSVAVALGGTVASQGLAPEVAQAGQAERMEAHDRGMSQRELSEKDREWRLAKASERIALAETIAEAEEAERASRESAQEAAGDDMAGFQDAEVEIPEEGLDAAQETPEALSTDGVERFDGDFRSVGRVSTGGWDFTWYSENVLPGDGLDELNGNGRHVDDAGFVCDGDGYRAVASDDFGMGEVVNTPFGEGKVYDCGSGSGTIDIYVSW